MRPRDPDRPDEPAPPVRAPVETKVTAATVASFAAGIAAAVLNAAVADTALLGAAPAWLQFLAVTVVPPAATFLAGYAAPPTPRPGASTHPEPLH